MPALLRQVWQDDTGDVDYEAAWWVSILFGMFMVVLKVHGCGVRHHLWQH